MKDRERWPANPHQVWEENTRTEVAPIAEFDRVPSPPIDTLADFTRRVELPDPYVGWASLLGNFAIAAAITAMCAAIDDGLASTRSELPLIPIAFVIVFTIVLVIALRCGRRKHPARSYAYHQRYLSSRAAVLGQVYRTSLVVLGAGERIPIMLIIDDRLDDERTRRLHAAVAAWGERLDADQKALARAQKHFESRRVVPLTEIFGYEADGGYLTRLTPQTPQTPGWALLLPHPAAADMASGRVEVLTVKNP
ncbi:hypothetical protein ACWDV4_24905 [Micromonospora sp. NPDC003197]